MNNKNKNIFAKFLRRFLDAITIIGFFLALYIIYQSIFSNNLNLSTPEHILITALLICGISTIFFIVYNMRCILNTVINQTPFVENNVKALKRISISSFIISITYIINMFFTKDIKSIRFIYLDNAGVHTDMEFLIFFFAACFLYILSKVFDQAVKYKNENDFTI